MKNYIILFFNLLSSRAILYCRHNEASKINSKVGGVTNSVIYPDVPNLATIRVGNIYYRSSTTIHISPVVAIMKSTNLINGKIISYAYNTIANVDEFILENAKKCLFV